MGSPKTRHCKRPKEIKVIAVGTISNRGGEIGKNADVDDSGGRTIDFKALCSSPEKNSGTGTVLELSYYHKQSDHYWNLDA